MKKIKSLSITIPLIVFFVLFSANWLMAASESVEPPLAASDQFNTALPGANLPGLWVELLGTRADQEGIDDMSGFDYDTFGIAVGYDRQLGEQTLLGIIAGYSDTDVHSDTPGAWSDINMVNFGVYGSYNRSRFYIDTGFIYGRSNIHSTRNHSATNGDTYSDSFSFSTEFGYHLLVSEKITLTQVMGFQAGLMCMAAYIETGTAGDERNINDRDSWFFSTTFGLRADVALGPFFQLSSHALWMHEFLDDLKSSVTGRYVTDGTYYLSPGLEFAENKGVFGIGFTFCPVDIFVITLGYDVELADSFIENSGHITCRLSF